MSKSFLVLLVLLQVLVSCASHQPERVPSSEEVSESDKPQRRHHGGGQYSR
ncbi:MAG: hypothetical protein H0V66_14020 [Bdellovibrionales bacterium]|nr:hypothetical protein [Bdellovibrionales bacterium]